jgi:hypothetical protein
MKLKADAATLQFRLPKSRPCGQSQDYKAGWSLGYVSAIDSNGRTIWIADAHRDDGKRLVVRADEKLTAFVELESAIRVLKRRGRALALPPRFHCPIFANRLRSECR